MSFILPIRAMLLHCFRDLHGVARQGECAELLRVAGFTAPARLLYDVMFIQTGFSADRIRAQNEVAARTKLWGDVTWDVIAPSGASPRVEIAAQQMLRLLERKGDAQPAGADASALHAGFAEVCATLCEKLRAPAGVGTCETIASLLAWISRHVTSEAAFDVEGNVGAAVPVLAEGLAFNALRDFIADHRGLLEGAFGSPGVFHEAARLEPAGFGPYLDGSISLAAAQSDGPAVIRRLLKGESGDCASASVLVQRGLILSFGLHGSALADLVDALAEMGAMPVVRAILTRAQEAGAQEEGAQEAGVQEAGAMQRHIALMEHIRSAGLSGGDLDLALQAQRIVLRVRPDSAGEWIILGDLEALAGNGAEAQAAFAKSQKLHHGNQAVTQRLDALRDGRVGIFRAQHKPPSAADALVRSALLRLALTPSIVQDQVDCAEMAFQAGDTAAARMLYDVIFIASGFSAAAIARQIEVERRLALWDKQDRRVAVGMARPRTPPSPRLAAEQLALLVGETGRTLQPLPRSFVANARPALDENCQASADDLHVFCVKLKLALRQAPSSQSSFDLRQALTWLDRHVLCRPPIAPEGYCRLDIPALASALAFNILREFACTTRDIAYGPFGSAELFHAAARLEEGGLGPYFSRCADRFADTRDIFGFIQLASRQSANGESSRDMLERWAVLLSTGFTTGALHRLVDALADAGLLRAVRAVFARVCEQSAARLDLGLMWSIRDAGLDHADYDLASRAQQVVIAWRPHESVEWVVLGEIEATAGNTRAAQTAFRRVLAVEPANHAAKERLDALETGEFERFRVTAGYGTNEERKRLRQGLLQAA